MSQHSQALEQLGAKREQILGDLAKLEKQVYDVENTYFTAEYTNLGTVLKVRGGGAQEWSRARVEAGGRAPAYIP